MEVPADVSFECKTSGNPKPTMFWSIEGNRSLIFPGTKLDRYETTFTEEGLSVFTIPQTRRGDNDLIVICSALSSVGSISTKAKLIVSSQDDKPPPIILQGPVNQTLPVKSVAVLACSATGNPAPVISWYRDGIPVVMSHKVNVTESGTLTISDLERSLDQGLYTCVASSRNGKSTWSGYLRLELPTNPNIKFYRAPEASSFPTAPGKPKIVNTTEDSITITWLPSLKNGASDIAGYQIEMFSSNISKSWIPLVQKLETVTYTQYSLTNGASYIFVIRAENLHGLSLPSPMSEPIIVGKVGAIEIVINPRSDDKFSPKTMLNYEDDLSLSEAQATLASGNVVELLEANATDSTSVRLLWEVISRDSSRVMAPCHATIILESGRFSFRS